MQLGALLFREPLPDDLFDAAPAQDTGQREEHVLVQAVVAAHQRRHGVHVVRVAQDALAQRRHAQPDGPRRVPLEAASGVDRSR